VNYRHLHYFWVVAKEGGIARAAERLDMAVQTVSAQVRELERALGHALLRSAGRRVELTEAGRAALHYAEQIFQLGEQLPGAVRDAATIPQVRFNVGISDGLPKAVVRQLLEPVLVTPHLRLLCHEGEFDELLAELALHKLDVVLADRSAPANPNLRVYSHSLGQIPMAWYAATGLEIGSRKGFPACMAQSPVLLPTAHSVIRGQLDDWFRRNGITPRIVGEFEDNASLLTFGISGLGVFPAPESMAAELKRSHGVRLLGLCVDVMMERLFAISAERRVHHPLVARLIKPATA
jgi:LysR family transcriptional activator of nhaA